VSPKLCYCCLLQMDTTVVAGAAYASIAIIALSTITSVVSLVKRQRRVKVPNQENDIYEDEDGRATEESMARYSAKTQFVVLFIATAVGLLTSLALPVFATVRKENSFSDLCLIEVWLLFPAWVCHPQQ
jgi:hypothetical protein